MAISALEQQAVDAGGSLEERVLVHDEKPPISDRFNSVWWDVAERHIELTDYVKGAVAGAGLAVKGFAEKHLSRSMFNAQLKTGITGIVVRTAAALGVYELTENYALTAATALASGAIAYVASNVLWWFPRENKDRYNSRREAMSAAVGYQVAEQTVSVSTIALDYGWNLGLLEWGMHPALAAAIGSFSPIKPLKMAAGWTLTNIAYKHRVVEKGWSYVQNAARVPSQMRTVADYGARILLSAART